MRVFFSQSTADPHLRSRSGQRGAEGVLHGLWQDGGALSGYHGDQAVHLGEENGQVGANAATSDTVT